ncbi:thioredoxin family protein [Aquimarina sp. MMG016]|uniref:thioredoxin family protein n=1 Tax=Aquimarina sp. MMG016 TaxID=2822690 RepID=UPI001B3A63DF|nr:thioredoxin family protein [Aquimarina sp. MMG016]MBQ4822836.1 thioredoxin family protein [Aquimarina sp. MMG016]
MNKSIFYHAGCPVCVSAEQDIVTLIGATNIEIIHLGEDRSQIETAEKAGVQSVPALLTPNGNVLHINYGASIADVKG